MNRIYKTPLVTPQWLDGRETHPAVAIAIHAISDSTRTPDAIWEAPTSAECYHVEMALTEYVSHGDFPWESEGFYWGQELVRIPEPTE